MSNLACSWTQALVEASWLNLVGLGEDASAKSGSSIPAARAVNGKVERIIHDSPTSASITSFHHQLPSPEDFQSTDMYRVSQGCSQVIPTARPSLFQTFASFITNETFRKAPGSTLGSPPRATISAATPSSSQPNLLPHLSPPQASHP